MKVLIIEDEVRAANRLERILRQVEPGAVVLARLESVRESVDWLQRHPVPDLILSDIQLDDGLSFSIYEQVPVTCPIIFTTAYDQYAIRAFETNGVDYLLKPIEAERLRQSLDKMRRLTPQVSLAQILALSGMGAEKKYRERFLIKVGEEIKSVPVRQIRAFFSEQKATFAVMENGRRYVMDQTLSELEDMLDPKQWFRTGRAFIVHLEACEKVFAFKNSRLKLIVKGLEDEQIVVARERVADFKRWFGGE